MAKRYLIDTPDRLPAGVRYLFILEGQDEVGLFERLLAACGAGNDAKTVCVHGIKKIQAETRRLLRKPEAAALRSVTIVGDADADPRPALDRLWGAFELQPAEFRKARQQGFLVKGDCRYAVWVSPGSGRPGALEDLVLDTLDDKTRSCIDELWRCAGGNARKATPSSKAAVAVWVALRDDRGLGLGTAFERGLVDLAHSAFKPLRSLLHDQLAHRPA